MPNGVDTERLGVYSPFKLRDSVGAAAEEVLCLHVGRPGLAKQRWTIPPIIAALRKIGVPARAVLVGQRDRLDESQVMAEAMSHHVDDKVHFLGVRDDIGSLMRQSDVVLLPSSREGLPGAVLEAVAVGVPTVACDLPGVRFIAEHVPGVTVVAGTDATAWACAIVAAGVAPSSLRDHEAALSAVRNSPFFIDDAVERTIGLYVGERVRGRMS
jgi:glycosyltransferase involved in cell wall biosynthesis